MPSQHTTEEAARGAGIFVPVGLSEWHVLKQEWQANGTIRAEVIATTPQAIGPHCQKTCVKIHATRARKQRDVAPRDQHVELILSKRRFRCLSCKKRFTEPDTVCGKKRRTTKCFREMSGKQASIQPVAHVAKTCGVSHHVVHHCFEAVATQEIERKGLAVKEDQPLHPPRFLGIDEFATRNGHRSDTIVCDLEARQVGEVRAGRKLEDVTALLERLCDPDAVKAMSMDRSASFRPAVQLCLPKAHIVVDHFPVMHQVMKGLKKGLSSWAHQQEGKPLLEGRQQLFLKAKEDVTEKQAKERTHLGERLPLLETAWHRKRRGTSLVCHHDRSHCGHGTGELDQQVQQHGPELMRKTLSACKNWRQDILAFFQLLPARISTGCVEGTHHRDLCLDAPGFWVAPSPAPASAHCSWRGRLTFFLLSLQRVERQKISGLLAHQRSFERKGKGEANGLIS